jgi:hypothetical protein
MSYPIDLPRVPPEMACNKSWAWQNIKYDLEQGEPTIKLQRVRDEMASLPDWKKQLHYWRTRARTTAGSEQEYAQRHVNCIADIIRMIVQAKLEITP